jgi:Methylase involved in ubiquinone/menaquinone biosynthesis
MLARAADKLAEDAHRVALVWCPAETLPFADDLFDLVTCLESLEFMASPDSNAGRVNPACCGPGGPAAVQPAH